MYACMYAEAYVCNDTSLAVTQQGNKSGFKGVGDDCLSIAALMAAGGNIFYRSGSDDDKMRSDNKKISFSFEDGDIVTCDILTSLKVLRCWEKEASHLTHEDKDVWCRENFIYLRAMLAASSIKEEMRRKLAHVGIHIDAYAPSESDTGTRDMTEVRRAIAEGFFSHLCVSNGPPLAGYSALELNQACVVHPSSTLMCTKKPFPQCVVYHELVQTSRLFMRGVTVVEAEWIEAINKDMYERLRIKLDREPFQEEEIKVSCTAILTCIVGKCGVVIRDLQKRFGCLMEADFKACCLRVWNMKAEMQGTKLRIQVCIA
jgi:HrpA-like RNA helicase